MATIAIVDAEAAESTPLALALRAGGHQVQVIHEGSEAMAHLRGTPPEAIILSVELPQTSGYSLCNKIKRDPVLASIPLLLVSSQATVETFEEHKRLRTRADAYGRKPYEIEQVVRIIATLLGAGASDDAAVERTEQARVADVAGHEGNKAVRFGEDPSVRDISHAPFLQHELSEDTAALSTDALDPEPMADSPDGLSDEQRWVEQALQGRSTEPLPPPETDAPVATSPPPTVADSADGSEGSKAPFAADAEAFPLHSEVFEPPPPPVPVPAPADTPPEPPDSRDTRIDPPKPPRRRRSTGKKVAAQTSATPTDVSDEAQIHDLRQQVTELEAALAEARAAAPAAANGQAQWAAIDAQAATLSDALTALQHAHDALLQQLRALRAS